MSSYLGIVIFNEKKPTKSLQRFWNKWQFLGEEKYYQQKRIKQLGGQLPAYGLPFDWGSFVTTDVVPIGDLKPEALGNILFIITPDNQFLFYEDYEAIDMTHYYRYQIYQQPPFKEIVAATIQQYKDNFFVFARCR